VGRGLGASRPVPLVRMAVGGSGNRLVPLTGFALRVKTRLSYRDSIPFFTKKNRAGQTRVARARKHSKRPAKRRPISSMRCHGALIRDTGKAARCRFIFIKIVVVFKQRYMRSVTTVARQRGELHHSTHMAPPQHSYAPPQHHNTGEHWARIGHQFG
jgi:hypothetical protein